MLFRSPQTAVDELIQAALRSGGRDNVTCIVLDATNVASDYDGAAQTAPRSAAAAEEEDTLPRTDALDLAPNGEVVPGAGPGAGGPAAAEPAAEERKDPNDGK